MDPHDSETNTLITEFDEEVEKRCKLMRSSAENTCENMLNSLGLILSSIPECVRSMPLKALIQNFDGDIQAATACFTPAAIQTLPRAPKAMSPKKSKKDNTLPMTQTMSLADLLKKQAAANIGLPPRTPIKNNLCSSNSNFRTPTRAKPVSSHPRGAASPSKNSRVVPRTPTHKTARPLF